MSKQNDVDGAVANIVLACSTALQIALKENSIEGACIGTEIIVLIQQLQIVRATMLAMGYPTVSLDATTKEETVVVKSLYQAFCKGNGK